MKFGLTLELPPAYRTLISKPLSNSQPSALHSSMEDVQLEDSLAGLACHLSPRPLRATARITYHRISLTLYHPDVLTPRISLLRFLRRRFYHQIPNPTRNRLRISMCQEVHGGEREDFTEIPRRASTNDGSTSSGSIKASLK
jgi:hypothetical protein